MTSKFNALLNSLGSGFSIKDTIKGALRPKGQMADWQHASRTFVDDNFRLAPKAKFLYHVYFDLNYGTLTDPKLKHRHQTEIGLLVKSLDLPKFTFKTQTLNQYNRKKVVQLTHEHPPINVKFHDDRANIVNTLWQNYYSYYYADPIVSKVDYTYHNSAMKGAPFIRSRYGFDNNSSLPFFKKITLYQINKREYISYTLINPMITSFNHDQPNSSEQSGGSAECIMTLAYEAVHYDSGTVKSGEVLGFAQDHYDKLPSPLSPAGGGTGRIFGEGGILDGIAGVADNVASGKAFSSVEDFVNNAAAAANTYQNIKGLTKAGFAAEGGKVALGLAGAAAGAAIGSVVKGISFPNRSTSERTNAAPLSFP
jgi:hypothetical protein